MKIETEIKYALTNDFVWKHLIYIKNMGPYLIGDCRKVYFRDTFFDTRNFNLLTEGVYLRCRYEKGDHGFVWTLKKIKTKPEEIKTEKNEEYVHKREEYITKTKKSTPAELKGTEIDVILKKLNISLEQNELNPDRKLKKVLCLKQMRYFRDITYKNNTVAILSVDFVCIQNDDGTDSSETFKEFEIELSGTGTDRDMDEIRKAIRENQKINHALKTEILSKFEKGLESMHKKEMTMKKEDEKFNDPDSRIKKNMSMKRHDIETDSEIKLFDTAETAAKKIFLKELKTVFRNYEEAALGNNPEAVHDMRVALRKMKGVFLMFYDYLNPDQTSLYEKNIRFILSSMGNVRDLDVFLENVKLENQKTKAQEDIVKPYVEFLESEKEKERIKMQKILLDASYKKSLTDFQKYLRSDCCIGKRIRNKKGDIKPFRVKDILPIMLNQRLADITAYDEFICKQPTETNMLHRLRIVCKNMRYTLEFFETLLGPEAEALKNLFKKYQTLLGNIHDVAVADENIKKHIHYMQNNGYPASSITFLNEYLHTLEVQLNGYTDIFFKLREEQNTYILHKQINKSVEYMLQNSLENKTGQKETK